MVGHKRMVVARGPKNTCDRFLCIPSNPCVCVCTHDQRRLSAIYDHELVLREHADTREERSREQSGAGAEELQAAVAQGVNLHPLHSRLSYCRRESEAAQAMGKWTKVLVLSSQARWRKRTRGKTHNADFEISIKRSPLVLKQQGLRKQEQANGSRRTQLLETNEEVTGGHVACACAHQAIARQNQAPNISTRTKKQCLARQEDALQILVRASASSHNHMSTRDDSWSSSEGDI